MNQTKRFFLAIIVSNSKAIIPERFGQGMGSHPRDSTTLINFPQITDVVSLRWIQRSKDAATSFAGGCLTIPFVTVKLISWSIPTGICVTFHSVSGLMSMVIDPVEFG